MVIITMIHIPMYVCFVAGLGPKFSYPAPYEKGSLFKYLIAYDKVRDKIDDVLSVNAFSRERKKFLKNFRNGTFRKVANVPTKAQKFIHLQMKRTRIFLNDNPNVKIFPADKGGRIVITDSNMYREKMNEHMQMNVNRKVYYHCRDFSFEYVRHLCESKYERIRNFLNVYFKDDFSLNYKNLCQRLSFQPFVIPRIYGCFKIHKIGFPVRPIISSTNCIGKPLAKWILLKLEMIAKHLGRYNVKSAHDLFLKIDGKKLNNHKHVLVTWDYDNMFTNVPFHKTKEIIRKFYFLIQKETTVPVDQFLEALVFLIEDCAYFSFENEMYLQIDGLSMGNSLSQILAEITTNYLLNEALSKFNSGEISFLYKYVDDIIGAIDETYLPEVQFAIESLHEGMKLKIKLEDDMKEVDYLQVKVGRAFESDNSIHMRWIQKEYSSKQIVNFHSFHPMSMKENIVKEYVANGLKLTTPQHRRLTLTSLRKTLRNSSYPNRFIKRKMRNLYGHESGPSAKSPKNVRTRHYISHPYHPDAMDFALRSIKKIKITNVSLSPTIISNNKRSIFSNMKDKRDLNCVINSSFVLRCKNCNFYEIMHADKYDIPRTIDFNLKGIHSNSQKHCECFGHAINEEIMRGDIVQHKNLVDLNIAKNVLTVEMFAK